MTKNSFKSRLRLALLIATPVFVAAGLVVNAAPASKSTKKSPTRVAAASKAKPQAKTQAKPVAKANAAKSTVPADRYLTMTQVKQWQRERAAKKSIVAPALQPYWEGHALKAPMRDLLNGATPDLGAMVKQTDGTWKKVEAKRFAQAFPRPVAPAAVRGANSAPVVPKWVRYPLEFQLAGIGLGSKAVDKDRYNRIDRYGLFAIHGNPTAVVRSIPMAGGAGGGAAAGGAGTGGAAAAAGGAAAAGAAEVVAPTTANLTLSQTPPEIASLFPGSQQGGLPDWALAVTVQLDNNHVEWLYKRETYSMGFVVDRLGFVDAIIVAGISSPIASTQLEDPVHTVQLGDDLRKVLFRYGYPDDIVPLASDPEAVANPATGEPGGGGAGTPAAAAGGEAGAAGAGGEAAAVQVVNGAFRTYDLRYEQSYNVVFTIRNNRVVRIYIFGDPDFFNAQRRQLLRTKY
jgi:hypothetical protein